MKAGSEQTHHRVPFRAIFLHPRYWLTWLGLGLLFLLSWLPLRLLNALAHRLGDLASRKNRKRVSIARTNLRLCFPAYDAARIDAIVHAHFRAYIRSLLHYGILWWAPLWRLRRMIHCEGFERIDAHRAAGRNVIILTCHSCGLEFTGIALSDRYPCSGPYKAMRNPLIDYLVARGRARLGTVAYQREQGFRPLIRDTREGRLLIYLADEDLGAEVSTFAPFFAGQKASINVLARLSRSCRAVVLPCVGCFDEKAGQYRVKLLEAEADYPVDDDYQNVVAMNRMIEQMVEVCMEQFFWTLRLFQTRPEGEASVYE